MRCVALIVAAGRGERLGGDLPKQFLPLLGRPMLRRTIERFLGHPSVDAVRVVIDGRHEELYRTATAGLALLEPVAGGASRQESVRLGLESLVELAPGQVLIHDAARPLASAALVERVASMLRTADAALPALPVVDTLKRAEGARTAGDVPRDGLWRAQTPQGFRFAAILAAHRAQAGGAFTDDAAVAAAAGIEVSLVEGEEDNMKITHPADLARAERLLGGGQRRWRTGLGFDVHRLVEDRPLILAGVHIPFERGLAGHSDADVVLHAVTDAILGAIAAGDIGQHFPPSDPRWKDADSAQFLEHAVGLAAEAGGALENVDVTILCERPKIGPHRDAMRERLAAILGLPVGRVGIKATTTEQLGFTGRGEGIAAQAVATLSFAA
ncbi:bifunctional 2-C-methyl-D-erythritol 4-phosphate cytidylyltransferase/2-C-methyl-D-erythritol 2,4-cyclodiphosphate synthase [Marinimicrococcus flavescens]|uniref:Bifunctional enzyme IspD/IspF n=1 Tax=Marinimicrococcus flavescens TaxID=3031815 RepID=A0AAP4D686_9PROT|nr:bifunctional 2-C-methyl-D-erythritol 4-phosphate cytidylyltransferase/2-C-methyl-D-erythritol 2,4-cyclodiphosphate synthase [Marinimicrococcus flavescens]